MRTVRILALTFVNCAFIGAQPICVTIDGVAPDHRAVLQAQKLASRMFAGIGIETKWNADSSECEQPPIVIHLTAAPSPTFKTGALAYALPYEGSHICVFVDRISASGPDLLATLLAHVMVHEMTHILEGIARHSDYGIMKAHWDSQDYFQMRARPLEFAQQDIDLIRMGIEARKHASILAVNRIPIVK